MLEVFDGTGDSQRFLSDDRGSSMRNRELLDSENSEELTNSREPIQNRGVLHGDLGNSTDEDEVSVAPAVAHRDTDTKDSGNMGSEATIRCVPTG